MRLPLVAFAALGAMLFCMPLLASASSMSEILAKGLVLPAAVAPYSNGRYVVADAALQRIVLVANDGTTTVLAGSGQPNELGSAPGGYADGKGSSARFNSPQGVAVDAEGNVYVADTGNHCIRRIAPDGMVSTFAGDPAHEGSADGRGAAARFRLPRGLTFDPGGRLLVADQLVGVREISKSGDVRTLPIPVNSPFDVAVLVDDYYHRPYYVVSDLDGLVVANPDGRSERYAADNVALTHTRGTEGGEPLGHPYDIAAYGSHSIVYTDRMTNEVRLIDLDDNFVKTIVPRTDSGEIRLSEPTGLRLQSDGRGVVIADAGHHRLTLLQLDPVRVLYSVARGSLLPPSPKRSVRRVALVGSSTIWWDTDWPTSIEGRAEAILNARAHGQSVEIMPIAAFGATADAQLSYVNELCEARSAEFIVFDVNSGLIRPSYSLSGPVSAAAATAAWIPRLRAALGMTDAACRKAGVGFIVAINPLYDEVSASENAVYRLLSTDVSTDPGAHDSYVAATQGLAVIDLWPGFIAAETANDQVPLFIPGDGHLSQYGRAAFATAFADAIERLGVP